MKGYIGSGSYGIVAYVEESGDTHAAKTVPKVLSSVGESKMSNNLSHLNALDLVEIITCEEAYTLKKSRLKTVNWRRCVLSK